MPTHAIKFRPWRAAPSSVATPVPGAGGFQALVPLTEGVSTGAPPVAPSFVEAATRSFPRRLVRGRSGWAQSSPLPGGRLTGVVRWVGLDRAQRDALIEWLDQDVRGRLLVWDLEIDSGEADGIGVLPVRLTEEPVVTEVERRIYVIEARWEQVLGEVEGEVEPGAVGMLDFSDDGQSAWVAVV